MTRRRRCRPRDRGSASVEIVIAMPVLMMLLMLVVQAGIYFDTQAVATAAARKALTSARVADGSAAAGRRDGESFLRQAGTALLDRTVVVTRTGRTATATVSGRVESVMFGVPLHVAVTVTGPVEGPTP